MDKQQLQQQFVNRVIGHNAETMDTLKPIKPAGNGLAPVNIALSKYWGKRDMTLNLPMNGSVSISLPGLGTQTTIKIASQQRDLVSLNSEVLTDDNPFTKRLSVFLNHFRTPNTYFEISTVNTVPTAAGLASSASGYAALVLALDDLFGWQLKPQQLSLLARLGSGSASRSLFSGFAIWHKGQQEDGLDSYAEAIEIQWPEFCVGLVKVNIGQKSISSTTGMQNTVETCDLYKAWPAQAEKDMQQVLQAIENRDFELLGRTAEHNALSMHATMMATWPPIVYWQPESLAAMHKVWQLRNEGIKVYFTMDAGPNLKLLFPETEKPAIEQAFPELSIIKPFN
ncbi:MAG: diphosphomevalonate decarboxylase [Thiomicrorhabdus sp.]|nr:MAG: diphosphomevalonate decarboxylase [Thiomicrorhabdus sp.]